jgi:N-acetylmuramoyl-L-alanine amidase
MFENVKGLKVWINYGLFLLLTTIAPVAHAYPPRAYFKFKTIVIDAGHGGEDPGAHGAWSSEKNVALAIAKKVQQLLFKEMSDVNVIMTRSTDKFVELNKRSDIANKNNANLFVSIHCNSSPEGTSKSAYKEKGVMLLVYGFHRKEEQMEALRENASIYIEKDYKKNYGGYSESDPTALIVLNTYMQKYRKQSILFGELLNKEFVNYDDRKSLGVKEQGVLVLAHSAMPAVLVETGYINNPTEEKYLNSVSGQNAIAASIVRAIKKYRKAIDTQ